MSQDAPGLSGPDFLDAVSNAERANGNDINAAEFERRAREWRQTDLQLDAVLQRNAQLTQQLSKLQAAANDVAATLKAVG